MSINKIRRAKRLGIDRYLLSFGALPTNKAISTGFMNMCRFSRATITDHVHCITGSALLEMVVVGEQIPVRPLVWHYYARTLAEGADTVQGRDHCCADELGSIGNSFHGFSQRFRDLECDDVQLFLFHEQVPSNMDDF
jgi:hypothetical protein